MVGYYFWDFIQKRLRLLLQASFLALLLALSEVCQLPVVCSLRERPTWHGAAVFSQQPHQWPWEQIFPELSLELMTAPAHSRTAHLWASLNPNCHYSWPIETMKWQMFVVFSCKFGGNSLLSKKYLIHSSYLRAIRLWSFLRNWVKINYMLTASQKRIGILEKQPRNSLVFPWL